MKLKKKKKRRSKISSKILWKGRGLIALNLNLISDTPFFFVTITCCLVELKGEECLWIMPILDSYELSCIVPKKLTKRILPFSLIKILHKLILDDIYKRHILGSYYQGIWEVLESSYTNFMSWLMSCFKLPKSFNNWVR